MVKLAYFHNEGAPYRIPLFEEISKIPCVDLKVYFGRYRSSDRKWDANLSCRFNYEILKEIDLVPRLFCFGLAEEPNPLNPQLLFKLLRSEFDIFISGVPHYFGSMITFLVSRIRRKPFVLFLEDTDVEAGDMSSYAGRSGKNLLKALNYPLILLRFFMGQIILKHSDGYIVPGFATKEYVLRRGVPVFKVFTACNAVDNDAIEKECIRSLRTGNAEKLRENLGIGNKKMILSVAYLTERKGLDYLIKACAKLNKEKKDFVLVIVGDGPDKQKLKNLCFESKIEARFTGYVSNLVDYYAAADIFVMPTLHDVWGFVINEAMVCGCPIVTTYDCGAGRDLVKNGVNGYLVKRKNEEQLYQAIKKILHNDRLRQMMKGASKDMIKNFSYKTSVEGYRAVINYLENKKAVCNRIKH